MEFAMMRMHLARDFDVMRPVPEPAALHMREVGGRGPDAEGGAAQHSLPGGLGFEGDLGAARLLQRAHEEAHGFLTTRRHMHFPLRRLDDLQMRSHLRDDAHGRVRFRAFEVVRHGEGGGELVPRRGEEGRVGSQHQRPARDAGGLGAARSILRHGHGHDVEPAREVIRHGVADLPPIGSGGDEAGPEDHGRLLAAFEGVEVQAQGFVGITAEGLVAGDVGKLGQDEVHELLGLCFEGAFAVQVRERVGQLVVGDLVDARVHRIDDHAAGARGLEADLELVTGADFFRRVECDLDAPFVRIGGEMRDGMAERGGEEFLRVESAHEGCADISGTLKRVRHADGLHSGWSARFEPLPAEHALALDGEQTRAGVGGAEGGLQVLAAGPGVARELDAQLGVALQAVLHVAFAHDSEGHGADDAALRVAQLQAEVARFVRWQCVVRALSRQGEGRLGKLGLAPGGDVGMAAALLLGEHGHMPDMDEARGEVRRRQRLQIRPHCQEAGACVRVLAEITKTAVRLVADHIGQSGHQELPARAHAAPAVGLEALDEQADLEAALVKTLQRQVKASLSLVIGGLLAEADFLACEGLVILRHGQAVVEDVAGELLEGEVSGTQLHARLQQPLRRRETEQSLQGDIRVEASGLQPAVEFVAGERHLDLHAVRLEVLHAQHGLAELNAVVSTLDQIQPGNVASGGGGLVGLHFHLHEAVRAEHDFLGGGDFVPGVDQVHLQGQSGQSRRPVPALEHRADVDVVTGTVNAALGEEKGLQRVVFGGQHSAGVEAGEVQEPVGALEGQEGHVIAKGGDDGHGLLLALKDAGGCEVRVAVDGGGLQQVLAVFCQHGDGGAVHRVAGLDALHKDIAAAIGVLFHQQSEVRHQHEAARACVFIQRLPVLGHAIALHAPLAAGVGLHAFRRQEEQPARGVGVRWVRGLERAGEVKRGVGGLVVVFHRHRLHAAQEAGEV